MFSLNFLIDSFICIQHSYQCSVEFHKALKSHNIPIVYSVLMQLSLISLFNLTLSFLIHLKLARTCPHHSKSCHNAGLSRNEPYSRNVTFHLRNIARIRKFVDQSTCHHAVRSLILSRLDYCNGLLSSVPKSYVNRLQRLQNWAARLIFEVRRSHPAQPLLNSLHWLPIQQQIIFKLLLFVYKSLNN